MTIRLSQEDYWEIVLQSEPISTCPDPFDKLDVAHQYPPQFGQGFWREIQLQEGVTLEIGNYWLHENLIMEVPDRKHPLEFGFYRLLGTGQHHFTDDWECGLFGSGMANGKVNEDFANYNWLNVQAHIEPDRFKEFFRGQPELLSPAIANLLRRPDELYYVRFGIVTCAMQIALQQILNCPYQGVMKRVYLESKVWELMVLQVAQMLEAEASKTYSVVLKSDDVERIQIARAILLRCLDKPPSLAGLARQVELNECTLKRGFQQLFGTTVFGYLHQHRMEWARWLLEQGRINVREAARAVGYASQSRFATAFRKRFGVNPREFLKQQRQ